MIFLFKQVIFRFHVSFRGCRFCDSSLQKFPRPGVLASKSRSVSPTWMSRTGSGWINGLFHLLNEWGIPWGYNPLILTIDPNFLGHPSRRIKYLTTHIMSFPQFSLQIRHVSSLRVIIQNVGLLSRPCKMIGGLN